MGLYHWSAKVHYNVKNKNSATDKTHNAWSSLCSMQTWIYWGYVSLYCMIPIMILPRKSANHQNKYWLAFINIQFLEKLEVVYSYFYFLILISVFHTPSIQLWGMALSENFCSVSNWQMNHHVHFVEPMEILTFATFSTSLTSKMFAISRQNGSLPPPYTTKKSHCYGISCLVDIISRSNRFVDQMVQMLFSGIRMWVLWAPGACIPTFLMTSLLLKTATTTIPPFCFAGACTKASFQVPYFPNCRRFCGNFKPGPKATIRKSFF